MEAGAQKRRKETLLQRETGRRMSGEREEQEVGGESREIIHATRQKFSCEVVETNLFQNVYNNLKRWCSV